MSDVCTSASDAYFQDQINKQYNNAVHTPLPLTLDWEFCQSDLEALTPERLKTLETLILYKNIEHLQVSIGTNQLTVYDLVLFYLHRTLKFNDTFHPIISLNPDCLKQAHALDARIKKGEPISGLLGIPLWIKDNIATSDPIPTTGGAVVFKNCYAAKDAPVVSALKSAGAILLGKSNLSEWANFMSSQSSNGYSAVGGQTRNPYGAFDVGGSSSGSAVAVALGLSPVSIGSETCGSLVYPASQNGVVTLKPPHEALSSMGVLPIAASFDTVGPMALNVVDTYLTYCALGGRFEQDQHPNFQSCSLHKKKIGLALSPALSGEFRPEDLELLYRIKQELITLGASVSTVNLPEDAFSVPLVETLYEEFEPCLSAYLDYVDSPLSLQEILHFNAEDPPSRAPFGQDLLQTCLETHSQIHSKQTQDIQKTCINALQHAFDSHQLDAIFNLSNYLAVLHALSGYPALTVPCGSRSTGEPIGVTFVTPPSGLKDLIEIGHRYCEETSHRKPPVL